MASKSFPNSRNKSQENKTPSGGQNPFDELLEALSAVTLASQAVSDELAKSNKDSSSAEIVNPIYENIEKNLKAILDSNVYIAAYLSGDASLKDTSSFLTLVSGAKKAFAPVVDAIDFSSQFIAEALNEIRDEIVAAGNDGLDTSKLQNNISDIRMILAQLNDNVVNQANNGNKSESATIDINFKASPKNIFKDLANLVDAYSKIGKIDKAVDDFIKCIEGAQRIGDAVVELSEQLNIKFKKSEKNSKDVLNSASNISLALSNVMAILQIDDSKIKKSIKSIRAIKRMFESPNILTYMGLSSKGLLGALFEQISESANISKSAAANAYLISSAINSTLNLANFSDKELKALKNNVRGLLELFDENSDNSFLELFKAYQEINDANKGGLVQNVSEQVFKPISEIIELMSDSLGNFNGAAIYENVDNVIGTIDKYEEIVEHIEALSPKINKTIKGAQKSLTSLSDYIKELSKIGSGSLKQSVITLFNLNISNQIIQNINYNLNKIGKIDIKRINQAKDKILLIKDLFGDMSGIVIPANIKDLRKVLKTLRNNILIIASFSLLDKPISQGLKILSKSINEIKNVIKGINSIKIDNKILKKIKDIKKFIIACGEIVLIGGAIGTLSILAIPGLIVFAVELSLFMNFLIGQIDKLGAQSKKSLANIKPMVSLILASGGILLLGAFFMMIPGMILGAFAFAGVLLAFVLLLSLGITAISMLPIKGAIQDMNHLNLFMLSATAAMAIGGLFMLIPGMDLNIFKFAGILFLFVSLLSLAITAIGMLPIKGAIKNMEQLNLIILSSAAAMIVGGLFMMIPGMPKNVLKFAGMLVAFVGIITLAFGLASLISKGNTLSDMKALNMIIIISAATMLIGGAFMFIDGMDVNVLKFAAILAGFIAIVGIAIGFGGRLIKGNALKFTLGLAAIILVVGGILLWAGSMMKDDPTLADNILEFAKTAFLLTAGMAVIIWALGKIDKKELIQGELACAGIAGIIWLLGEGFQGIASALKIVKEAGGMDDFDAFLGRAAGIFGAVIGVVGAIAAIAFIPGFGQAILAAIGVAEALVGGIAGIILLIGKALQEVAIAAKLINEVKDIKKEDIQKAFEPIKQIFSELKDLDVDKKVLENVNNISRSMKGIGEMLESVGRGVQAFANLKIPVYTGTKITEYLTINSKEFSNAADNIEKIISTLGTAIIEVYNKNPKMFDKPFIGNTPFTNVVKSCTGMGSMLSKISKGLMMYAKLQFPEYKGTEITGYKEMKKEDFAAIAANIGSVILTLGNAIKGVYVGNEEMFDKPLFKDTPYKRVVDSCGAMGSMISKISEGVIGFASGRIPKSYDKEGKVTEYMSMTEFFNGDGQQKVTDNISKILTSLSEAIKQIDLKDIYDVDKMQKVIECMNSSTDVINKSIDSIKKVIESEKDINDTNTATLLQKAFGALPDALQAVAFDSTDPKKPKLKEIYNKSKDIGKIKDVFGTIQTLFEQIVKTYKVITDSILFKDQTIPNKTNLIFTEVLGGYILQNNKVKRVGGIYEVINNINNKVKDFNDAEKNTNTIKRAFIEINSLATTIVKMYENLSKSPLMKDSTNTIENVNGALKKMFNGLTKTEADRKTTSLKIPIKSELNIKEIRKIEKDIYAYSRIFSHVLPLYENANKLINSLSETVDIEKIGQSMTGMANQILQINFSAFQNIPSEFVNAALAYKKGIESIAQAYRNEIPSKEKQQDLIDAIQNISNEVSLTKDPSNFVKESHSVRRFVSSINHVDIAKTNSMTKLLQAMNENLNQQNSNKMTQLINQLVQVLAHVAEELNQAHTTLNRADAIQKKRQEAIRKSIDEINRLINKPVEVIVREDKDNDDQTNNPGPGPSNGGGYSTSQNSSANSMFSDLSNLIDQLASGLGGMDPNANVKTS